MNALAFGGTAVSDVEKQVVSSGRFKMVIAVLLMLTTISYLDRTVVTLMVDPIKSALRLSDTQLGFVLGPAFASFFVLGTLPMGWIVDHFSKRWVIYFGVTFWSLATISCGMADSFGALLMGRCLVGVGEATLQPASWGIMSRLAPAHRLAFAISIFSSGAQIGASLASVVGGQLVQGAQSMGMVTLPLFGSVAPWQLVFLCCGLPGLVFALLTFAIPREPATIPDVTAMTEKLLPFLRTRAPFLACHMIGFSMLAAAAYGMSAWTPTFLMRNHGLAPRDAGLVMAMGYGVFGTFGTIFAGWLVDRLYRGGRRSIHLSYFALTSVGVCVAGTVGFAPAAPVVLTMLSVFAICLMHPFSGVAAASLQIATPLALRGRVSALYVMSYNLVGMALGPTLVPFLAKMMPGQNLGFAIMSMLVLCAGTASSLLFLGRNRLVPADPQPAAT